MLWMVPLNRLGNAIAEGMGCRSLESLLRLLPVARHLRLAQRALSTSRLGVLGGATPDVARPNADQFVTCYLVFGFLRWFCCFSSSSLNFQKADVLWGSEFGPGKAPFNCEGQEALCWLCSLISVQRHPPRVQVVHVWGA